MRSPTLLLIRMNAAETSASRAIADWTPLTVVSRSPTTAEIETFISDVSTTSTNIAAASRRANRALGGCSSGTRDVSSMLTAPPPTASPCECPDCHAYRLPTRHRPASPPAGGWFVDAGLPRDHRLPHRAEVGEGVGIAPAPVGRAQPAVQGLAPRGLPRGLEVPLRLAGPSLLEGVQTSVEEGSVGAGRVSRQVAQPFPGEDGVLVLPERFLHILHRLGEGDGVLAESPAHRFAGVAGPLGGLAGVVQQLLVLGAGWCGVGP